MPVVAVLVSVFNKITRYMQLHIC